MGNFQIFLHFGASYLNMIEKTRSCATAGRKRPNEKQRMEAKVCDQKATAIKAVDSNGNTVLKQARYIFHIRWKPFLPSMLLVRFESGCPCCCYLLEFHYFQQHYSNCSCRLTTFLNSLSVEPGLVILFIPFRCLPCFIVTQTN